MLHASSSSLAIASRTSGSLLSMFVASMVGIVVIDVVLETFR